MESLNTSGLLQASKRPEVFNDSMNIPKIELRCDMRFPTMLYVQPAKAQTSLRICAVWSEPLLFA